MTTTTLGTLTTTFPTASSSAFRAPIANIRIEPALAGLSDQVDRRRGQRAHHATRRIDRRDEKVPARARPGLLEPGRIPEPIADFRGGRPPRQVRIESVDDANRIAHREKDRGAA